MSAAPFPATLQNWKTAPHSRWAFRHIDQILPVDPIRRDPARSSPLPAAVTPLAPFEIATSGGPLSWESFLHDTQTDGLLIMHQGSVVLEWRAPEMAADSRHIIMSATKSIVGMLCGMMAQEGMLDLSAPVTHFVPEVGRSAYRGATLRDLLDMRTRPAFTDAELQAYAWSTGWDPAPEATRPAGMHAFFAQLGNRESTHKGPFRYLSANTDLLGWVMERAANMRFAQLAGELLWQPLGARQDATITLDWAGAPRTTGGLSMTLEDLARVGNLLIDPDSGFASGIAHWLDDTLRQGDPDAWSQGEFARAFGRPMHYRNGWYVVRESAPYLFAMGIFGQHLFVDPHTGLVMAKLSSQPKPQDPKITGWTLRAFEQLRRRFGA